MIELAPVLSLSYSDLRRNYDCTLKSWPRSKVRSDQPSAGEQSRQILAGNFFHELLADSVSCYGMELNKGRKGISELFQLKLTSYRKVYSNNIDFQSFDYWGEIGAALETVLSIFESYEKDGIVPEREVWLESQSDKIHGVIDELIVNSWYL